MSRNKQKNKKRRKAYVKIKNILNNNVPAHRRGMYINKKVAINMLKQYDTKY